MDTSQFVAEEFAKELLGPSVDHYRRVLATGNPDDGRTSLLFAQAMRVFQKLSPDDQVALSGFFAAVITDTASLIFGVIDGSTSSDNLNGEFRLLYEDSLASGDLHDFFLAAVEQQLGA